VELLLGTLLFMPQTFAFTR